MYPCITTNNQQLKGIYGMSAVNIASVYVDSGSKCIKADSLIVKIQ